MFLFLFSRYLLVFAYLLYIWSIVPWKKIIGVLLITGISLGDERFSRTWCRFCGCITWCWVNLRRSILGIRPTWNFQFILEGYRVGTSIVGIWWDGFLGGWCSQVGVWGDNRGYDRWYFLCDWFFCYNCAVVKVYFSQRLLKGLDVIPYACLIYYMWSVSIIAVSLNSSSSLSSS